MEKVVKEHNEIKHLIELEHYETHEHRTESKEFKRLKEEFHKEKAVCFINNGYCEGNVEIHHNVIEWSAQNEVDWEKVQKDHPGFAHCDMKVQMIPLCSRHHRGKYTGIHSVTYPIWILQKYMLPEPLADFEKAVKDALSNV